MSELKNKLGKFFIILGGLFILLFVFSMVAESVDFSLIITGVVLMVFGTILRKKPKIKKAEQDESDSMKDSQGRNRNSVKRDRNHPENRQSRRSRRP
jgi:hypothetical protein